LWTSPNPPFAISDSCAMDRFFPVIQAYSDFGSFDGFRTRGISVEDRKGRKTFPVRCGGKRWGEARKRGGQRSPLSLDTATDEGGRVRDNLLDYVKRSEVQVGFQR
jgi:hypothetical protein